MSDICFYLTHYPPCKGYKFTFLSEELRKLGFDVETVLCSTEVTGVSPGEFNQDEIKELEDKYNTTIKTKKEMLKYVKKNAFKYFVVGTYSGDLQKILTTARSKGAKVIEIATLGFNDPVEHNADINLLISELGFKAALNKRPGRAKKAKNRIYVGSLFADDIENTYTSSVSSIEQFKSKYGINEDRIFLWLPGREDLKNYKFQKRMVGKVGSNVRVLAKPHPWSYKLNPDVIKDVSGHMTVIEARDAYWSLMAMDAAISINSTVGIEIAVLRKPIIYLQHVSRRPFINKNVGAVGYVAESEKHMFSMMKDGDIGVDDIVYDKYLAKVYPTPFIPSYKRICEFFRRMK